MLELCSSLFCFRSFLYTLSFENLWSKNLVVLDPEIEGSQFSRTNMFVTEFTDH
jgi:hypothetical protein